MRELYEEFVLDIHLNSNEKISQKETFLHQVDFIIQMKMINFEFQSADYILKSDQVKSSYQSINATIILFTQGQHIKYVIFHIDDNKRNSMQAPLKEILYDRISSIKCSKKRFNEFDFYFQFGDQHTCFQFSDLLFLCSYMPKISKSIRNEKISDTPFLRKPFITNNYNEPKQDSNLMYRKRILVCSPGYLETAPFVCVSCDANCLECEVAQTQCKSCVPEKFLDPTNKVCKSCIAPCKECTSETVCTSCVVDTQLNSDSKCQCQTAGKFFDTVSNGCIDCDQNCLECIDLGTKCTKCATKKYLDTNNICQDCNLGCTECDNSTTCIQCNIGYYLDLNSICQLCNSSCKECLDSSDNCISCADGYYLIDNTCQQCEPSCLTCDQQFYCSSCPDGYYLESVKKRCLGCHIQCKTCLDNQLNCTSCNDGYYLDTSNNKCTECTNDCKTCNLSNSICTSCFDGYYLDTVNNSCIVCDSSCTKCVLNNSVVECLSCTPGYYLNNALCPKCDDLCKTCVTASNQCTSCYDNYSFDIINSQCQICDKMCKECDSQTKACLSCFDGYVLKLASGTCELCQFPCKTCSNDDNTHCDTCYSNYFKDALNQCNPCMDNCKECSASLICTLCQDGYILDPLTTDCKKCDTTCKTCVNDINQCTTCFDGYYLDASQCKVCIQQGCQVCKDATTCQPNKCASNYYYDSGTETCIQCKYPCINCTNDQTCDLCNKQYYQNTIAPYGTYGCSKCDDHCQSCTNSNTCNLCDIGYYKILVPSPPQLGCLQCMTGCKECLDGTTCITCEDQYYNDPIAGCQLCNTGCKTCNGLLPPECNQCEDKYYKDSLNACVACTVTNCKTCSDTSPCIDCDEGYIYESTPSPICSSCSLNCKKCLSTTDCDICQDKYYKDSSNACVPCIANCQTCSDISPCIDCEEGYFYESTPALCSLCSLSNCKKCQSTTNCGICQDGYFIDSSFQCSQCDPNCKKCSSQADFCDDCNEGLQLILNKCELTIPNDPCFCENGTCTLTKKVCCDAGYVLIPDSNIPPDRYNYTCSKCPKNCQECSPLNVAECITCDSPYLLSEGKTCIDNYCKTEEYFDTISGTCKLLTSKCSPGCIKCNSFDECTECLNDSYYIANLSPPPPPIKNECQLCKYPCSKCQSDGTCIQCIADFILDSSQCLPVKLPCTNSDSTNQCSTCPTKFYLDDTVTPFECKPCKYICTKCKSESECEECIPGYFLDPLKTCQPCNYNCATCSDALTCIACFGNGVTRDIATNCDCKDGYFQIANDNECTPCDPMCKKCAKEATNCLDCNSDRVSIPGGKCQCLPGYFDRYLPVRECVACHPNCSECIGSEPNECLSCKNGLTLNPLFNTCQCGKGYFDDNGVCKRCLINIDSIDTDKGCIECVNASECIKCDLNMDLASDFLSCNCKSGYYQNGYLCEQCDVAFCEDCKANKAECMKCFFGNIEATPITQCKCSNVTDEFESNLMSCSRCHFSCASCDGFEANNCLTCPPSREYNASTKTCDCLEGTYEDESKTQTCQPCHYSCKKCNGSFESDCTQCPSAANRQKYPPLSTDIQFKCECIPGYYDVSPLQSCSKCDYQCETCVGKDTFCLSCSSSALRILSSVNTCVCPNGYYDDGLNFTCQKCHYSCKICSNGLSSGCLQCPENSFRFNENQSSQLPGQSFSCTCYQKYFDDGSSSACLPCHFSCKNCIGPRNIDCIECDDVNIYKRTLQLKSSTTTPPTGECQCIGGYLDDLVQISCKKCPFPCDTCNQQGECVTCNQTRDLDKKTCVCKKGYLEVGNLLCKNCSTLCQECEGTIYTCLKCNAVDFLRVRNEEYQCNCKEGYYDLSTYDPSTNIPLTEVAKCLPCKNKCRTCGPENPEICFTCFTVYNYILNKEQVCECMFGFIEGENVCNETFLVENEFIDESKVEYFKNFVQLLLMILKYLSWAHLLMNQPFQSLLGFRVHMILLLINFTNIKVNRINQTCLNEVNKEDPFSVFNFLKFITPSESEKTMRKLLNKRLFLENHPLSFLENGQGYFFLFIIILSVYILLKFTLLRNSILLSTKIYRKQRWRYKLYLIHHNHIFPFFMTILQILMMKILYFGLIEIVTTYDYAQTGSILSLTGLSIYGIAYLAVFIVLYQLKFNENSKIKKLFQYDLKPNNPYFFFLQFSIDIMIISYHAIYAQDFKQQTIIIVLALLVQAFFVLIQKPFKYWWENIFDFITYGTLSAMFFIFQSTSQLTLTQLMDEEKYKQFNTYSYFFNYSLCVALIACIVSISIRIIKGLVRIGFGINSLRRLKDSDTVLWELEIADTQRIVTEHRKSLLATDQQQINKNILKEIMNSQHSSKQLLTTQVLQTITLSAKKPFKKV